MGAIANIRVVCLIFRSAISFGGAETWKDDDITRRAESFFPALCFNSGSQDNLPRKRAGSAERIVFLQAVGRSCIE